MAFEETPPESPAGEPQGREEKRDKPGPEPLAEITVCLYPGGKIALALDGGEKKPVPDIDTALTAIRRLAEIEGKNPNERAEKPGMQPGGEEMNEDQAMMAGYEEGTV